MAAKERKNTERSGAKKKTTSANPSRAKPVAAPSAPAELNDSGPAQGQGRLDFPVVGIGASAGGLDAFMKFFKAMPADCGMAFILIPHLDPTHDSLMVELLARQTPMEVSEVTEGQTVQVNHVYIIPPNKFLTIRDGRLLLTAIPEPRGRQMALDSFFRSLAEDEGDRAIGIVFSGTGNHGTLGLREIKLAGGMAMVQQPESAGFDQMPSSAIATGLVDYVLPPEKMPEALIKYVRQPYLSNESEGAREGVVSPDLLNRILVLLRIRTRYDFRCYRKNMLMRRIQRRMGLWQIEPLASYLELLRENPDEVLALYKDLLIGVTSFFRDPEAFQVLEQRVIPELVERNGGEAPVRVWVPGCATGEEAYSIAILLIERFTDIKSTPNIQIFASDLDDEAIRFARAGIYPDTIAGDLSPERLRRFFIKTDEHSYQVNKRLREAVVFAPQNLIGDAPFSKLDLISCRNLLIYLEPDVQTKVLSLFHFALNADGFLMLGPSETVGRQGDLFALISSRWRVYRRAGPSRRVLVETPIDYGFEGRLPVKGLDASPRIPASLVELMQKRLLADYAPASVLISRKFEVLCFHGPTVKYLEFPDGEPTRDLLALARHGLRSKLRSLVVEAIRTGDAVTGANLRARRNETYVSCQVTVKPLLEPKEAADLLLVVFEDRPAPSTTTSTPAETLQESSLLSQLENELKATREDLQGMIEELESSNEEMKASNEEVMSMNEEMQSVNEELETSKEELQSANEELNTLNNQLNLKVAELNSANNDITNLLDSTDIPTVFLAMDLRIRRFTPSATKLFHLLGTDVGRPIDDIARRFSNDNLIEDCQVFVEKPSTIEREIQSHDGRHYQRRILPYRTADEQIEGAVVTFIDITERKQAEELLKTLNRSLEGRVASGTLAAESLQRELLSIAEDEQRRIGQDLHDDIGQELTGLAMKAETLQEIVVERNVPESALAAEIVAGLDRTRAKVRALSRGMIALEVESNGLVSALAELTARLGDTHGVTCLFEGPDRSVEIEARRATHLYHIAQEAIANAIKHGHASTIRVTLEIQESTMKLEISDNGDGISKDLASPDGMGLRIMSYRAGLINGKLSITRGEPGGTLVSCLISVGIDNHGKHNKAEGPGRKR